VPSADPGTDQTGGAGLRYDQLHRLGAPGGWRLLLAVPMLVIGFLLAQVVFGVVVATLLRAGGASADDVADKLSGDPATPSFLALIDLGWAAAIGLVLLVTWLIHSLAPGWICSVVGRLRWRWMLVCAAIAVAALGVTLGVAAVLPDQGSGSITVGGPVNDWTSATRDFVLVVVLLTPLQAAGEEFVFRGYLAQAFGGLLARLRGYGGAAAAVVLPSVLFALAHGLGQDLPIFFDRLAFGLVAGTLVLLTGGLEAGIAMHVLNNLFAFGLALAFGDMTESLTPTDGTWWAIPVTLTQSMTYLLLTWWAARRLGVAARTDPAILAGQRARV